MNILKWLSQDKPNETMDHVLAVDDINGLLNKIKPYELDGVILIMLSGEHVNIDATGFSEAEAVWALEKAKHKLLNGGLSLK